MSQNVTIIKYHYVRDLKKSDYPNIKGLDISLFKEQILYLKRNYNLITMEMLIDSIYNGSKLPNKSALLTLDDGYSDHFRYVFPFLKKQNIQGSFFPPAKAITENKILDVNKIHFILAKEEDVSKIIFEIKSQLKTFRNEFELFDDYYYFQKLSQSRRYDSPEVSYVKSMLQFELDSDIREKILNSLFDKIIGSDEETFSKELYLNLDQIQNMKDYGMHFGGHGYNHYWLGSLNYDEQKYEIEKTIDFLNLIGCDMENWTMCYPYGSYNENTIKLMNEFNFRLAFTTNIDVVSLQNCDKYRLSRLDTNDIPKSKKEHPNDWFFKA
jgi:peptidoglycan/xylan/chitin deacetylase (PgdA/CDA1 family)